jgi:hypothetical protein
MNDVQVDEASAGAVEAVLEYEVRVKENNRMLL